MVVQFASTILAAAGLTLLLAIGALVLASALGLALAGARLSGRRWLAGLAVAFTFVIRGIPDLVMMLLAFYSLPALINQLLERAGIDLYVDFSPFAAGTVTLGILFSAYMSETFRSALGNIPAGQIEAAQALGLHPLRIFLRITLPQMALLALPGFTNNWLVLVKATALVSLIGLQDVMFRAKAAAEATGQPFTYYLVAAGFYLLVTLGSTWALARLGRRLDPARTGARA
ncbi:ABC transporter permease subunit [Pseudooceanicola sp. CBS1P-1]|uniref:ABC transporter permease subunit n=1 Tax=Pseudooceanicola albus TaxID=2692189 RepID=A0A6L7G2H5_9RHOB|nr:MULTISPECIES: ABC transporter permease subunit [Pseudooceanicola]MBT9385144.1 ABC transporter permease subunit [Pseudooceanicola endophyticus]MXN18564.1 ABC transporter permease subunit [Pseudooceanicola albus]